MALLLVQPGIEPHGQYALADGYSPVGGELGILYSTGTDTDGYQVVKARFAVSADTGPFFLMDDGTKGYGVYFGNTVTTTNTGFTNGADVATRLGPATYAASGKVTLWGKPGHYGITLDALGSTDAALKAAAPNAKLTVGSNGKLELGGVQSNPVAFVVRYGLDESLVTTGGSVVNKQKLVINFNPFGTP